MTKITHKDPLIGLQVRVCREDHKAFGRVGKVKSLIDPEQPLYLVEFAVHSPVTGAWTRSGSIPLSPSQFNIAI